jgi:hypothetical protein
LGEQLQYEDNDSNDAYNLEQEEKDDMAPGEKRNGAPRNKQQVTTHKYTYSSNDNTNIITCIQ